MVTHATGPHSFFEIATQVRRTFELVNRDVDHWLRVSSPETRCANTSCTEAPAESVKRIHQATDTLEDRVRELAQMQATLETQLGELNGIAAALHATLHAEAKEAAAVAAAA
jgi:hypothetical protein